MLQGRSSELKYLESCYQRNSSQIIVMYGGHGVGKQAIIREFLSGKPHCYYRARPASEKEQLFQWGGELACEGFKLPRHPCYEDIFATLKDKFERKKVLVVENFTYIMKNSEAFIPKLIETVHGRFRNDQIMVVLISSQVGFIENSLVDKLGENAYELSGFLKIDEFGFFDLPADLVTTSYKERVRSYAVIGGYPAYWKSFSQAHSTRENIISAILSHRSPLGAEAERVVGEELRETGIYFSILAALASGHTKLNDIYRHTDFSRAKIIVYLKTLQELELVEKTASDTGKSDYRIVSRLVRFYFTYLYPHLSALGRIGGEVFYDTYIAPSFESFVAEEFRAICMQKLALLNTEMKLPLVIESSGEWSGKDGCFLDIVARSQESQTLIGMCNWEKPLLTYEDYEWLLFCAKTAEISADFIYLFSAGGFDEQVTLEAKVKEKLTLIKM